jgi:hypothetical protein
MSDHFVDPSYQKMHKHDLMGGTPHLEDEDGYRREHIGRDVNLSDHQFEGSYPTAVAAEAIKTRPNC